MPTVTTSTLWHCFSHHQWAGVGAVIYGCMAAYALTHSTWVSHLGMGAAYHHTGVGTKAVAMLSFLCAIIFAQAGSLRLLNPRPDIAAW